MGMPIMAALEEIYGLAAAAVMDMGQTDMLQKHMSMAVPIIGVRWKAMAMEEAEGVILVGVEEVEVVVEEGVILLKEEEVEAAVLVDQSMATNIIHIQLE